MVEANGQHEYSGQLAESRQNVVRAVAVVFIVLDTIAIALRFSSKRIGHLKFGSDDGWIFCGFLFSLALLACSIVDVNLAGLGLHEDRVIMIDPDMVKLWAQLTLVLAVLYQLAVVTPKLGILVLYLNIFSRQRLRFACYAIGCVVILNCISSIIAVLLICIPLHAFWDHSRNASCLDTNSLFRWTSFANIVTDAIMLVLPVPTILQMYSSVRVKLGIFITLAMGSVGLVFSILRFAKFFAIDAVVDVTWSGTDLVIWTMIESSIYLIAACLIACRPLARFLWRKTPFRSTDDIELEPSVRRTYANSSLRDPRLHPQSEFQGLDSEVDSEGDGMVTSKDARRSMATTDTQRQPEIGYAL